MKTRSGKKVVGIRTAIRDMRESHNDGKWCGWIAFNEKTGDVYWTTNPNVVTPTLKYEVENEKELKEQLVKQFGCIDE